MPASAFLLKQGKGGTVDDVVAQTLRRRRRRRGTELLLGAAAPLALLIVWELLVWFNIIDHRLFPAPTTIVKSGYHILTDPSQLAVLGNDIAITLQRLVFGYVIGAVAGIAFGVFMGVTPYLRASFAPLVFATFPTPKLAIFPLLLVIFGIGDASKIALVTLGVFYMTCINTLSGVLFSSPVYHDMAKAFRVPAFTAWMKIVVPSALPSIITGLKLALGQALILVMAAEFVAADNGIGQFIWNAWQTLDIAQMFLGLMIAATFGVLAMLLGNTMERKFIPWVSH